MQLIHEIKAARAAVKVHYNSADSEYLVKLYHLAEKAASSGRGAGVMLEYVPARYSTDSKEDAISTAEEMINEASNTAPADPVRYNEWRLATFDYVEKQFIGRADGIGIESGADFVAGATAAMMAVAEQLYKIDPDKVGGVISPRWLFGCMRGELEESIREAHQKPEAVQ